MILKAVIVEDERRSQQILKKILSNYAKDVTVVGEAVSIKDAVAMIKEKHPQIVFLDVELKDGKGFEVLNHFKKTDFVTIVVTGYDHYAIEAIKQNTLDYILKPVIIQDVLSAVKKASEKLKELSYIKELTHINTIKNIEGDRLIIQKAKDKIKVVKPENVMYIQAQNQYTKWFLKDDSSILVRLPLLKYQEFLPSHFYQIHRSYVVNLKHITSCDKGRGGYVEIAKEKLPISDRRKNDFLKKLSLFNTSLR
jgi:two-component system LytT family response regulator